MASFFDFLKNVSPGYSLHDDINEDLDGECVTLPNKRAVKMKIKTKRRDMPTMPHFQATKNMKECTVPCPPGPRSLLPKYEVVEAPPFGTFLHTSHHP